MRTVIFRQKWLDTSQECITVKIIRRGDNFGAWNTWQVLALIKVSDHEDMAVWTFNMLVSIKEEPHQTFTKEPSGILPAEWEMAKSDMQVSGNERHAARAETSRKYYLLTQ